LRRVALASPGRHVDSDAWAALFVFGPQHD
jgi:hypothetical protein